MLHIDYITNSIFNSRTYILSDGSDKVWTVDCGDVEPVRVDCSNVRVVKEGGNEPAALRQVDGSIFRRKDFEAGERESGNAGA